MIKLKRAIINNNNYYYFEAIKLLSTQITQRDENNSKDWKHIA